MAEFSDCQRDRAILVGENYLAVLIPMLVNAEAAAPGCLSAKWGSPIGLGMRPRSLALLGEARSLAVLYFPGT